ncbi:MAG: FAD-dependent oxidoreductase [Candidatus Omnitrophica bacterium]|nr:FAD-dependent oxidoreductase [Candidatus Omnitrophota bacterium]
MKVVIIGGVAAGPKAGSRIHRLCHEAEVTLIEKGEFLSYAGCGLPYYISGEVKEQKELMCTPIGVVRDPVFFRQVKNVRVFNRTEALRIDRQRKKVEVKDLESGKLHDVPYDKLVIATGSRPMIPPIEGVNLKNVFTLQKIEDSEDIKNALAENKAKDVVIVGGGLIGIEMTEALIKKGCRVTVIERLPHILPMLDEEMVCQVEQYLESKGVKVKISTAVTAFLGKERVTAVKTEHEEIPCDFVILAAGVTPQVRLAKEAGLEIGVTGGIKVDERMQTGDPDVYAAGDCCQMYNLITRKPCYVPLGSTANKQARVAANVICGLNDSFPGVIASTVCKIFDFNVARTGLSEVQARQEGFDVVTVLSPAPDKAHFYPTAQLIILKLVVDKKTRRLLGAQAVGRGVVDRRIDIAATAITANMTVDDISHLDLTYAPPYSPAMDNLITACDIARNKLDGLFESITIKEVKEKVDRGEHFFFLDVRSPQEYNEVRLENTTLIPLGKLRARIAEIPKEKEIITFCKISLRGYEAARILQASGYKNVKVMDGGIAVWPYEKIVNHS